VAQAMSAVRRWWNTEGDSSLRIYSAIHAIRTQDMAAAEPLVLVLQPIPEGTKATAQLDAARACAVRALQEATGEKFTSWEQWNAWREKNRVKPPVPRRENPPQPPPVAPK
jgi:hypothetical protein